MNTIRSQQDVLAKVRELGLPRVFESIALGELPGLLGTLYNDINSWEIIDDLVVHVPELMGTCPFWDQNGDAVIGVLPSGQYVRFYYEDGGSEDIEVLGENYQQFVTALMLGWADAGLEDHFEVMSDILEYRHLPELRRLLDSYDEETGEAALEEFKASL
jgi:hypothetical protein